MENQLRVLTEINRASLEKLEVLDRGDEKAKDGQRSGSSNHEAATVRRSAAVPEDVSMYDASKFQKLTFAEAAPVFLAYKRRRVKPQTVTCYEMYFRYLVVHFGPKRLYEITVQEIEDYQKKRASGELRPIALPVRKDKRGSAPTFKAGPSLINHEINTLAQMLEKAGQWERFVQWYTPLREKRATRPKTLTREQEDQFFKLAASNPDWAIAYWVASFTNNTSAAGIEIRTLKLIDIDLQGQPPKFQVRQGRVDTEDRTGRVIPLNETAYKQMCRIVERAVGLGACHPEHYVFPFRVARNNYDFSRPATKSWLKKQWNSLRIAAGMPWLTPRNLRFQCCTRMRAAGVPAETLRKTFGWKNIKMLDLYDEPTIDILYDAVRTVDPGARKQPEKSTFTPQWMPKRTGIPQKNAGAL